MDENNIELIDTRKDNEEFKNFMREDKKFMEECENDIEEMEKDMEEF